MKIAGALVALALTVCMAGSAHAQTKPQDTDASRLAVARKMIHAWKVADWRKVADLFSEDGSLKSMMLPSVDGREAIYTRIAALGEGAPDGVTLDIAHIGVIDGLVFMERTDRFVYNGHPGAVPVVGVLDIRGGKVKEWREYYDRESLEKALKGVK